MNDFLNFVDRYRYGILAVLLAYISIFLYLQISSYEKIYTIEVWDKKAILEKDEVKIEIKPENIEIENERKIEDVKSITKDLNDTRQKSLKDWTENKPSSAKDIEKKVKELEAQFYKETGESEKRNKIIENQKNKISNDLTTKKTSKDQVAKPGGDKVFAGNVMVEWSLKNRSPHLNNNWYVRNPGYTCGEGASGVVTLKIKVDQAGNVLHASVLSNTGSNPCMVEQALKYAQLSRFAYSELAPTSQEGIIKYTFVSQ
jgi:outer membrane biosynthesis protein TonB